MVNGLYTSAGSMMHLLKKQEVTSNNLANINTTGFKMAKLLTRTSVKIDRNDEAKLHQDEDQKLNEVNTSFAPGPLVQTGNNLDMAITSDGFFQIGHIFFPTTVVAISIHQEKELSREFLRMTMNHYQVIEDPLITDYVNTIGQKLVQAFPPQPFKFHFYEMQSHEQMLQSTSFIVKVLFRIFLPTVSQKVIHLDSHSPGSLIV